MWFYKLARQCGGPAGYPSGDNVAAGQLFWAGIIHLTACVSIAALLSERQGVYNLARQIAEPVNHRIFLAIPGISVMLAEKLKILPEVFVWA